jgi:hypothetical protein
MKLNPQRFTLESFREQADWIGNLLGPLNTFIQDTVIGIANNLTVADNLYQEIREIKFKNEAVNFPLKFRTKFSTFPKGFSQIYLYDNDTNEMSIESPVLKWTYSNGDFIINSITGLTANKTYTIRLLVIYG